MARRTEARRAAAALLLAATGAAAQAAGPPLAVCMAEDNRPFSYQVGGDWRGLDVRIATAVASELQRELRIVPFESQHEGESSLAQEVNALLSSGVCELATGYALVSSDLGPPQRATARVPDHPGAPRKPLRPWVKLGTLAGSQAYIAMAMGLVVREGTLAGATLTSLSNPGERARIGVLSGTLSGSAVAMFKRGALRPQLVSLSSNEDPLTQVEAGRIDATLVPLQRLDAWRLAHPQGRLQHTGYLHPLRINMGAVARVEAVEVLAAANRVIEGALARGELPRWAAEAGLSWVPPAQPNVGAAVGLGSLMVD